jgi:hypothetical protein
MNASAYRDLKFRTAGRLRPTVRTFFAHVIPAMRRFGLQQPSLVKCLQSLAVSMGRCNTGLKFTSGGLKAQSFSRALIQL